MRKRNNSDKVYFTKETEKYITLYNSTDDIDLKNQIFTEHIYYPFYKLAENIINTFKFYHIDTDTVEDLKLDIVTMLQQEKIHRFDPSNGAKAFSYFGTIVKRWLIAYCNKNYDMQKHKESLVTVVDSVAEEQKNLELPGVMSLSQFIDYWVESVYSRMYELFPKEPEFSIADAVLTVFKSREDLEIFRKKALYVYLKEITGCEKSTFITKTINILREDFYNKYNIFREQGRISENL